MPLGDGKGYSKKKSSEEEVKLGVICYGWFCFVYNLIFVLIQGSVSQLLGRNSELLL